MDGQYRTRSACFRVIPSIDNIIGKIQLHVKGRQSVQIQIQRCKNSTCWCLSSLLFSFPMEVEILDFPDLPTLDFGNTRGRQLCCGSIWETQGHRCLLLYSLVTRCI